MTLPELEKYVNVRFTLSPWNFSKVRQGIAKTKTFFQFSCMSVINEWNCSILVFLHFLKKTQFRLEKINICSCVQTFENRLNDRKITDCVKSIEERSYTLSLRSGFKDLINWTCSRHILMPSFGRKCNIWQMQTYNTSTNKFSRQM